MFLKLVVVILAMGATSAALLVNRQQRIVVARETALLHEEILAQQQQLQLLRCQIAERSRPDELRQDLQRLEGPMEPIVLEPPRQPTALALVPHQVARRP
jgi:hypothetical protein